MGEDVNTISPTLGFNIQTVEYGQYAIYEKKRTSHI